MGLTFSSLRAAICGSALAIGTFPSSSAAVVPNYSLVGSFTIGAGAWDLGPDGRVYRLSGSDIFLQNSVNSSNFTKVGSLPAAEISSFGASFLRVSPDGSTLAIGDGQFSSSAAVRLVSTASLNPAAPSPDTAVVTPNYDATWNGNASLFVTGSRSSDFVPVVNQITLSSPSSVQTVITGIGSASGGIAIRNGVLYTGSGYVPTGEIRFFALSSLGASAVSFSSGSLVGSVLSASPLGFDGLGNLLVGGGDIFSGTSDYGYAAVLSLDDPSHILKLSPAGTQTLYSPEFNPVTQELLVYDTNTGIAYRYAIPAPASFALLGLGFVAGHRRR